MCEYCDDDPHSSTWAEHKNDHLYNTEYDYYEDDVEYCEYCEGSSPPEWITPKKIVDDYVIATHYVARLFTDDDRRINMWYKAMVSVENLTIETIYYEDTHRRSGIPSPRMYAPPSHYEITVNDKNGNPLEMFVALDMMYFYTEHLDDPERSKATTEFYVMATNPQSIPYWLFPTFQDIYALNARFDNEKDANAVRS